jgi:hypothetical protein
MPVQFRGLNTHIYGSSVIFLVTLQHSGVVTSLQVSPHLHRLVFMFAAGIHQKQQDEEWRKSKNGYKNGEEKDETK